jgi:hypothetical protein
MDRNLSSTINLHISADERTRWNKAMQDIKNIQNGTIELPPGDGTHRGSSMNDFTNEYKKKLDGIEEGANKYIHPPTHPASMITGLAQVAISGDYNHLINRPLKMIAEGGNCDTINGIKINIANDAPEDPAPNKNVWINPTDRLIRIFTERGWEALHAVWA